jgi:hypothetical protein
MPSFSFFLICKIEDDNISARSLIKSSFKNILTMDFVVSKPWKNLHHQNNILPKVSMLVHFLVSLINIFLSSSF